MGENWVGHHFQQCKLYGILAGTLFLLSKIVLCLAHFVFANRISEICPVLGETIAGIDQAIKTREEFGVSFYEIYRASWKAFHLQDYNI